MHARTHFDFPPTLHVACRPDVCGSSRESKRLVRSRASHPRLPSAEFDQVSFLLPRECPHALSSSPSAHPILPAPSTFATDTRLVALIACIPLSDRNSQLTRTRAEDCARCLLILKDTRLPSLSFGQQKPKANTTNPSAHKSSIIGQLLALRTATEPQTHHHQPETDLITVRAPSCGTLYPHHDFLSTDFFFAEKGKRNAALTTPHVTTELT
ncbi:hypothetical protein Q7P35_001892 [Cladosporium inversicolor]